MNCEITQCENQAKYQISGAYTPYRLCAECAAIVCLNNGDQAGYDKFMAVK